MGPAFQEGGAGGFAQGLQAGAGIFNQIQDQKLKQAAMALQQQAQEFQQDQAVREQKLRLDALKLQQDQRKKQQEFQQRFFQSISGGTAAQGGRTQASTGGAGAPPTPSDASSLGGQNPLALLSLAAQGGQLPAFNAAVEQGFIQTPAAQQEQATAQMTFLGRKLDNLRKQEQIKRFAAEAPGLAAQQGLDLEKTRAEIRRIEAQTSAALREPQERLPTKASIALQAAGGDPVEALKFLESGGLSLETREDGTFSFSTNKPSTKLFNDAVGGIQDIKSSMVPLQSLRDLLASDPTSPTAQGQIRLLGSIMQAQIGAFQPQGPTGKEIQARITKAGDVSQMEFLSEMAAFSLARINNADGKISDADVASSRKALGLGDGLFRVTSASDIIPRLDAAFELASAKAAVHQDTLKLLGQGQIMDRQGAVVPATLPQARQQPVQAPAPQPAPPDPSPITPVAPPAPPAAPQVQPAPETQAPAVNKSSILSLSGPDAQAALGSMSPEAGAAFLDSLTDAEAEALLQKIRGGQ